MATEQPTKQVSTFCPLCVSRCGAKATITDGAFVALQPDPSHPTGQALCVKGKSAPEFEEPRTSPRSRPDLAERFPLILTCAKSLWFCESQHRNLASLRRRVPDPQVELHLDTARSRGIAAGDWVGLETWQACAELGLPGYPPFGPAAPT